jgi:hypothetical protein
LRNAVQLRRPRKRTADRDIAKDFHVPEMHGDITRKLY